MKRMLGLGILLGLLSTSAVAATDDIKLQLKVIDTVKIEINKDLDLGTFIKNNNKSVKEVTANVKISNIDEKEKGRLGVTIAPTVILTDEVTKATALVKLKLDKYDGNIVKAGKENLTLTATLVGANALAVGTYKGSATVTARYD